MENKVILDADMMRQCPYDSSHQVRSKKFEYHLIKCKKNHSMTVDICPFNAKHVVLRSQYRHHLITCPDSFRISHEVAFLELRPVEQEIHEQPLHNSTIAESMCGSSSRLQLSGYYDNNETVSHCNEQEDWESECNTVPIMPVAKVNYMGDARQGVSKSERKKIRKDMIELFKNNLAKEETNEKI